MNINDLLKIAVENEGLRPPPQGGQPAGHPRRRRARAAHRAQAADAGGHHRAMAFSIMNARQKQRFKEELELDIAYSVPGLGRFRCNVFQQRGAVGMVLRVIPARILTVARADAAAGAREDLRGAARPGAVHRHHRLGQVDHARGDDRLHQRHARRAHRHHRGPDRVPAPRQEVDRSTSASSTSTPAPSPPRCAPRCARTPTSSWSARCATTRRSRRRCSPPRPATWCSRRCTPWTPPRPSTASSRSSRRTTRSRSASSSRRCCTAVISLRLLPRADGIGRVPAVEVMIVDAVHPRLHREQGEDQVHPRADRARHQPVRHADVRPVALPALQGGLITLEEAMKRASNPDEFRLKIEGVQFTADMSREQMERASTGPGEEDVLARRVAVRVEVAESGPPRPLDRAPGAVPAEPAREPRGGDVPRTEPADPARPPRGGRRRAGPATPARLDLLARRSHFESELERKLTRRGYSAERHAEALDRLRSPGLPRRAPRRRGMAGRAARAAGDGRDVWRRARAPGRGSLDHRRARCPPGERWAETSRPRARRRGSLARAVARDRSTRARSRVIWIARLRRRAIRRP